MTAMATAQREWLYYVAKTGAGKVLIIARWDGPQIEILNSDGQWVPRNELLTRFQDPGYLENVTLAEARETAIATGTVWPS
jgi:hypothetical protein